jgi:hypothetical protein
MTAMLLVFSATTFTDISPYAMVEAATPAPSLKVDKATLYVGYKTHIIQFKNLASNAKITYKSSNSKVAKVTGKGIISPVAKGTTTILTTVTQNKKSYTFKFTAIVFNPNITYRQKTDYLNIGDTYQFAASANGISDKIIWSVSNTNVASISSTGKLKALKEGTVTIYAKAGSKAAACKVVIGTNSLGTFSTDITIDETTTIWINSSNEDEDEALSVDPTVTGIATYRLGSWSNSKQSLTIIPKKVGTDTITITSSSSKDRLVIKVTVVKASKKTILSSKQIYSKCVPNTVEIRATTDAGEVQGSGFFIENGKLVTNYHVIEGASDIVVTTSNKKQYTIKNILGFNADIDLAVLELNINHNSLEICQKVAGGETVYALGSPFGFNGTMTKGMVSTPSRVIDGVRYIQIDASISHGNSGGPLINEYGEVIGINTMYYEGGQNLNFAVSIKELQKINTNEPITVTEYYKLYDEYWSQWFYNNIITEDTTMSQNPYTSQTAFSGYGIKGILGATESADYYQFIVTQEGFLSGSLQSDSITDMKNTTFSIYNDSGVLIYTALKDETTPSQYIYQYLNPGRYIVKLSLPNEYSGGDTNYLFSLSYN